MLDTWTFYYLSLVYSLLPLRLFCIYIWRYVRSVPIKGEVYCKLAAPAPRWFTAGVLGVCSLGLFVSTFEIPQAYADIGGFCIGLMCLVHAVALVMPTHICTKGFFTYTDGFTPWDEVEKLFVTEQGSVCIQRKDNPSVYIFRKVRLGRRNTVCDFRRLPVAVYDQQQI